MSMFKYFWQTIVLQESHTKSKGCDSVIRFVSFSLIPTVLSLSRISKLALNTEETLARNADSCTLTSACFDPLRVDSIDVLELVSLSALTLSKHSLCVRVAVIQSCVDGPTVDPGDIDVAS